MKKLIIVAFLILVSTSLAFAGGHSNKSSLYLVRAQLSTAAFKGFVSKPENREAPVRKLFEAVGVTMKNLYFSISGAEVVVFAEGSPEGMAAVEMVVASTGIATSFEAMEIIDAETMTSAMQTAGKALSAYRPPGQ